MDLLLNSHNIHRKKALVKPENGKSWIFQATLRTRFSCLILQGPSKAKLVASRLGRWPSPKCQGLSSTRVGETLKIPLASDPLRFIHFWHAWAGPVEHSIEASESNKSVYCLLYMLVSGRESQGIVWFSSRSTKWHNRNQMRLSSFTNFKTTMLNAYEDLRRDQGRDHRGKKHWHGQLLWTCVERDQCNRHSVWTVSHWAATQSELVFF